MRTKSTFSVLFWINSSRSKTNEAKLFARISINGKRVNLSLKHSINPDSWDSKRSKLKGRSSEVREINQYLDHVRSDLYSCYREIVQNQSEVTAHAVKASYLGEEAEQKTLQNLFDYHNLHHNHNLSAATLSHYKTTQKYLLEYVKSAYSAEAFPLNKLDFNFVTGFETFLRNYRPKHYQGTMSNNGAMKHIQRFRKMVKIALNLDWVSKNPLKGFQIKMEKKERDFLTSIELQALQDYNISIERLGIVRDLFLFSCYTGLAYCDIMALKSSQITEIDDKKWLITERSKTGNAVRLPLLKVPLEIIMKYQNHIRVGRGKLLPGLSNQKLNSYLKELADKCGINKHLTFHMARHTFATTITLTNGVPIETVSKLLGHSKIATTQIYARVLDRKIGNDMNALEKKLKEKYE